MSRGGTCRRSMRWGSDSFRGCAGSGSANSPPSFPRRRESSGFELTVKQERSACGGFISFDKRQKKRTKEKRFPRHGKRTNFVVAGIFRLAIHGSIEKRRTSCAPPSGSPGIASGSRSLAAKSAGSVSEDTRQSGRPRTQRAACMDARRIQLSHGWRVWKSPARTKPLVCLVGEDISLATFLTRAIHGARPSGRLRRSHALLHMQCASKESMS